MKKITVYPNRTFRMIISAFAAFYILIHARSWNILDELRTPIFYIAFTVSFVVAMLMVKWVHYITIVMDRLYNWYVFPVKRFFWQLLLGVFVPLLMDIVVLSIYFYALGSYIFENGFFRYDFPAIVFFILLLNTLYTILYLFRYGKTKNETPTTSNMYTVLNGNVSEPIAGRAVIQGNTKGDWLKTNHPNIDTDLSLKDYVLFFYADDRYVYLVNYLGDEIVVNTSLTRLAEQLKAYDFFRVNRSFVLNGKILFDYGDGEKRDTINLYFLDDYKPLIEKYGKDRFIVTKNYIQSITRHFD